MDLVPRDLLLLLIGLEIDAVLPVQLVKVHFSLVIVHNLIVLIDFAAVFVVGIAVMLLVIVIVGGA